MTNLLQDKNIVIYGAGGGLGSGIARTFAAEGASLFLTGRTRAPLERLAADITAAGGRAEVAVVDALDEQAVDAHARDVAARGGSLDVSLNLITRGDVQGTPLVDMAVDDFVQPTTVGLRTQFLTARAAGRQMREQGSGVILWLTSGTAAGAPRKTDFQMGGTGAADAATEMFMQHLASELGPRGVRVVGIWTAGVPETFARPGADDDMQQAHGMSPEDVERAIAGMSNLGRAPRLAQVADTAAFLASDRAGAITASVVNVTSGLVMG
jgi:NAD(P)-dependent dehydrogenase (short-subunit alcohol dehydrogenase family)